MDQCDQKQLFDRFCVEQFKDRHDKTSKTISREKGQRIVDVIKKDPSAVTYSSQFKFWVKKKRFELISQPALELKLCLPAKNSGNVTKHSRLHVHHSRVPRITAIQGFDSGPVTARNITRKSVLPNFARHVLSIS